MASCLNYLDPTRTWFGSLVWLTVLVAQVDCQCSWAKPKVNGTQVGTVKQLEEKNILTLDRLTPSEEYRFPTQRPLPNTPCDVVASLEVRPFGIAMSKDERLFVSLASHLRDRIEESGVREILPDGSFRPFPSRWASDAHLPAEKLAKVLSLAIDNRGVLWILDSGHLPDIQPKLVGWDLQHDAPHRILYLPAPITKPNSLLVSVVIDEKRDFAFIADQGRNDFIGKAEAAIISVDIKTGESWRAFEDHYSLNADGGDFVVRGEPLLAPDAKGSIVRPSLGVAGLVADSEGTNLLFGAANGRSVFQVPLDALRDRELSSAQIGERVTRKGDKPPSQGLLALGPDYVLVSDVNNNGLGAVDKAGGYHPLTKGEGFSWPTSFAWGQKGEVYLSNSQLHRAALFHRGEDLSQRPFTIARCYPRVVSAAGNGKKKRVATTPGASQRVRQAR
jgi:hypothetical protein